MRDDTIFVGLDVHKNSIDLYRSLTNKGFDCIVAALSKISHR